MTGASRHEATSAMDVPLHDGVGACFGSAHFASICSRKAGSDGGHGAIFQQSSGYVGATVDESAVESRFTAGREAERRRSAAQIPPNHS